MRLFVFAYRYPARYKPYYDAQFENLLRAGHDVRIFAGGRDAGAVSARVARSGLDRLTRSYPATARDGLRAGPGLLAAAVGRPARLLAAWRTAAASGGGLKSTVIAVAGSLTVGARAPDACLVHGLGTMAQVPWLRAQFPRTPIALYYHGGEVPGMPTLAPAAVATAFRQANVVFTNTNFSREQAIRRGCPAPKLVVLPVGFDVQDYEPGPRTYRPGGTLRILSAGRLSPEKGLRDALEAIAELVRRGTTAIRYAIAGDGPERPALEALVTSHALDRFVTFLGALTPEATHAAMRETDVLVLSSIRVGNSEETQATAVQEAMLMKAVVVTTRTGGVAEGLAPDMHQFSVPPNDPLAIAGALDRIARLPENELRALGEANRAFVQQRYELARLNDELLAATLRHRPDAGVLAPPQPAT